MTQVLLDGFVLENNVVPMLPNTPNSKKEGSVPTGMIFVLFCVSLTINSNPLMKISAEKRRINLLGTQLSPKIPNLAAISKSVDYRLRIRET